MGPYTIYKEKIIECTRWLSLNGFFGSLRGTGGNVSMRVQGEESFVVTPSTLPYDQLTPEEMCVLDFDKKRIEGKRKPSRGVRISLEGLPVSARCQCRDPFSSELCQCVCRVE